MTKTRTHRRELERAARRQEESRAAGLLDETAVGRPLAMLTAIAAERDRLAQLEVQAVAELRAVETPWAVIGRVLGITGQAASKRYGGVAS